MPCAVNSDGTIMCLLRPYLFRSRNLLGDSEAESPLLTIAVLNKAFMRSNATPTYAEMGLVVCSYPRRHDYRLTKS